MENYEILKTLGSGAQGTVFQAKRKSDNKEIALKVITSSDPVLTRLAKQEINLLKSLSDPVCYQFVVCYYGSFSIGDKLFIEMEFIKGTDMLEFIQQFKTPEEVNYFTLLIAKDLGHGLNYIHGKGIIHNDIKFENIMIDEKYVPKLIDFGLACQTNKVGRFGAYCNFQGGTPDYIPPEFFVSDNRNSATDMWALGIVLFGAGNGHFPFPPTNNIEELFVYIQTKSVLKSKSGNPQLDNIVNRLLVKDPGARLTANEMLQLLEDIPRPANVTRPVVIDKPPTEGTGLNKSVRKIIKTSKGKEYSFAYL